jgi:hypothetical protein
MADSGALRAKRYRLHGQGDHSLCRGDCVRLTLVPGVSAGSSALEAAVREELGGGDPMILAMGLRLRRSRWCRMVRGRRLRCGRWRSSCLRSVGRLASRGWPVLGVFRDPLAAAAATAACRGCGGMVRPVRRGRSRAGTPRRMGSDAGWGGVRGCGARDEAAPNRRRALPVSGPRGYRVPVGAVGCAGGSVRGSVAAPDAGQ